MKGYADPRLTLDPGLTALALRGLRERDGHYPFLDRFVPWRRPARAPEPAASRRTWWRPRLVGLSARAGV
jgi:hypothetical protein